MDKGPRMTGALARVSRVAGTIAKESRVAGRNCQFAGQVVKMSRVLGTGRSYSPVTWSAIVWWLGFTAPPATTIAPSHQ